MLIRLYRILRKEDEEQFQDRLTEYTKQTSGQYIYQLERTEIPKELEKLGQLYHKLYQALKDRYKEIEIFSVFERVYQEHYRIPKREDSSSERIGAYGSEDNDQKFAELGITHIHTNSSKRTEE